MTRQDYIQRLEAGLAGFDADTRRDLILEIEDHIDTLTASRPSASESEIIACLENPENLARSLCLEAGIKPSEPAGDSGQSRARTQTDSDADLNEQHDAEKNHEEKKGKGPRITIDGQDLDEVIRRALDIARMFGTKRKAEAQFDVQSAVAGKARIVSAVFRSADVAVKLSVDGIKVVSDKDGPGISIINQDNQLVEIRSASPREDPERVELWIPADVDELKIITSSGDIRIIDRVGDSMLQTASGNLTIECCSGNVTARTASGDIKVQHCSENTNLETASGDIQLEIDDQANSVKIATASGDVDLRYPEEFDATITYATVSGDIDHDCVQTGSRTLKIGQGFVPIKVQTVSGDIKIRHT